MAHTARTSWELPSVTGQLSWESCHWPQEDFAQVQTWVSEGRLEHRQWAGSGEVFLFPDKEHVK